MRIQSTFRILIVLIATLYLSACTQSGTGSNKAPVTYGQSTPQSINTPSAPGFPSPEQQIGPAIPQVTPIPANLPPVKVALLVPLSGQHEKLGQSMLNAAQIALFDTGYKSYQLIPKDTKGTPDGARMAARSAIDEGAQLVLGPVFSESVRAAKPIAASANTNMIAFSTDWSLAGNNTFIMGFLPFDQVERIAHYAATRGINNIGVIAPENNYGRAVINIFDQRAPLLGLRTPKKQTFNPRTTNLNQDIRSFAEYDARKNDPARGQPFDAVLMPAGGQQAITITNLMTQYNLAPNQVRRLGTGLMDDPGLNGEPGLEGTLFAAPSPKLRRDFENKYRGLYARPAPRLATLAYDATALSAILARQGLQTKGEPSFDRRSLTNPNGFFGIDGIFRFRADGTAERGLAILEFKNGRPVVVDDAPRTFQQRNY